MLSKNTICLWYKHDAEEAARFYAAFYRPFPTARWAPCTGRPPTIPPERPATC